MRRAPSPRPQCLAAVALLALATAACKADLYGNLDERQANEIVAVLQRHGIAADRTVDKDGRITISVDDDDFARAFDILRDNGLPRRAPRSARFSNRRGWSPRPCRNGRA